MLIDCSLSSCWMNFGRREDARSWRAACLESGRGECQRNRKHDAPELASLICTLTRRP